MMYGQEDIFSRRVGDFILFFCFTLYSMAAIQLLHSSK
ncbi:hypothetical protein PAUR_a3962 [Pseudoalteromonas aurantia 208]|uniref:Uncharacterized protein n=1 Tax=Pseudoalteromonas aurantia 208 TaxID=1314867 RepID=A0ABR9EEQ2_9GAMM|nr:hypothetical protein [Pseudoalteromonas aurantia 208]